MTGAVNISTYNLVQSDDFDLVWSLDLVATPGQPPIEPSPPYSAWFERTVRLAWNKCFDFVHLYLF